MFPATTSVRQDFAEKIDGLRGDGGTGVLESMRRAHDILDSYSGMRSGCQEIVIWIGDGADFDGSPFAYDNVARGCCGYWSCCGGDSCSHNNDGCGWGCGCGIGDF